jgi:cation diffusion facilitator CzcD-associated flavoprotein CzcO
MGTAQSRRRPLAGNGMSVAVIGAGVTGLVWADTLSRLGFDVVIYEREASLGGQWLHTYSEVGLHCQWQNTGPQ